MWCDYTNVYRRKKEASDLITFDQIKIESCGFHCRKGKIKNHRTVYDSFSWGSTWPFNRKFFWYFFIKRSNFQNWSQTLKRPDIIRCVFIFPFQRWKLQLLILVLISINISMTYYRKIKFPQICKNRIFKRFLHNFLFFK